ncbi:MAG: autotransporter assembly complex protein TamA [Betaproteobacteria bacterium]
MLAACAPAAALAVDYRVEIEAPRPFADILRKGLNLVRWQDDPNMGPEQLRRLADEAVREAQEVAATEGYFSARVQLELDEKASPWRVVLRVDPGERTRVSSVEIGVTGPAAADPEMRSRIARVRQGWTLRPGEPFRQSDWDAAKRQAVRELARWRYAAADVGDAEARIDPDTRQAALRLELASGPPFRVGDTHVSGTRRYPEEVVANLSPLRPGDTYDRDQLIVYQRRLLETGYFASVQAELDAQPAQADAATLRVAVIEAPAQHVEAGVSYNTDAGPRVELRYSHQDVFDSPWRFRSGLRVDQKAQDLQLDLDSPPRPGARWNNFFARGRRADIQQEQTETVSFGVNHNFGTDVVPSAVIASINFEQRRVFGDVADNSHALYLGHRRSFRRTDDVISPRAGWFGSAEVGGAPPGLASRQFLRALAGASYFIPLGRADDFLIRGQAGAVISQSRSGIPSLFLFRTGGDQTVRGYAFESLGVRQGEAVVGGRYLLVGSAEYTHWVAENWGIAAFVDAGNAWDSGVRFEPAVGYGAGVRFRTPIGPIRADLAYGQETQALRLHFSVGYTF